MTAFHSEKRLWSEIKHGILKGYLPLFVNKLGRFQNHVYFIDGFAGPGKYDDGQKGSALISADIALNPLTKGSHDALRCINVEKNLAIFAKLEETTSEHVKRGLVENIQGEFEKQLPSILKKIDRNTALFFIDPFGTGGATSSILKQIAERKGITEVLVRFDDSRLKRLICFNKNDQAGYNPQATKTRVKFSERAFDLTDEDGIRAIIWEDPKASEILVRVYIDK
jgi:three-Cys-motif partner protein